MKAPIFEIKVALIGYVSVGKTTVLNALFREKYGEVSMRRTTAAVNCYRIDKSSNTTTPSVLSQTIHDNFAFRNSDIVQENAFDVALEAPLHEMRNDTRLVIVDVPGINEAGSSSRYADYTSEHWHEFDCVVLVLDGKQGANTEEQLRLLKLTRKHLKKRKVPVIILCNKVDDPDDEEQKLLVEETRSAVARIFHLTDRIVSVGKDGGNLEKDSPKSSAKLVPQFIPASAMHAFMYRSLSQIPFELFQTVEPEVIEKLGKENYGRQWNRWDTKQKMSKAYEIIGNEQRCREGLESSNFEKFLEVLSACIGDLDKQKRTLKDQLLLETSRLYGNPWDADIVKELESVHLRLESRVGIYYRAFSGRSTKRWRITHSHNSPSSRNLLVISCLAVPVELLHSYFHLVRKTGWDTEDEAILERTKRLVLRQGGYLMDEENWMSWGLSSMDKVLMFGSTLLILRLALEQLYHESLAALEYERVTCPACTNIFGTKEGLPFCFQCRKHLISDESPACLFCARSGAMRKLILHDPVRCSYCWKNYVLLPHADYSLTFREGRLTPNYEALYNERVQVEVPDQMDDPAHCCHLSWRCCQLIRLVQHV
jgi:small GTP-binding protein